MVKITFGDMSESLYRLRQKYGLLKNFSNKEIVEEAVKVKKMSKRKNVWLITCLVVQIMSIWCIDVSVTTLNLGIMTNEFFKVNPIQTYHLGLYTLLLTSVITCFVAIGGE